MRQQIRLAALLCALALATPARAADSPALTGPEFEAFVTGKSFSHSEAGSRYGAEEYLPGHRVIWQDGTGCTKGHWQIEAGLICFTYEGEATRWCWSYHREGTGLVARLMGEPGASQVSLQPLTAPLNCPMEPSLS